MPKITFTESVELVELVPLVSPLYLGDGAQLIVRYFVLILHH
jgi:hypothetical protein